MEIVLFYHLISPWGIHLSLIYNPAIEVIKRPVFPVTMAIQIEF